MGEARPAPLPAREGGIAAPGEAPPAVDETTPEGELAPTEVEAESEQEPESGDFLELDRKGEKCKVSKEEVKRLAQ